MGWIEDAKRAPFDLVAGELGIKAMSFGSYGPCPGCGSEHRSSQDRSKRGPLGKVPNAPAWACHRGDCDAKGDVVELASWSLLGQPTKNVSDYDKLKEFFEELGFSDGAAPASPHPVKRIDQYTGSSGKTSRKSKKKPTGPHVWNETLPDTCSTVIWTPAGSAVLEYLTEARGLTEHTIKEWMLGALLVKQGGVVVEQWVSIPLWTTNNRISNIRFRSVPGPCLRCDAQGCDRCEDGRVKKTFRVCPGRPLPLFGANTLTSDHEAQVIVTEGELDVLALWQYGHTENIVSGTAGAGMNWPDDWLDQIEPYSNFLIAYDNDKAGNDGALKLAGKLGLYRCSRAVMPMKDAGECLAAAVPKEKIDRALAMAGPMIGLKIRKADEFAGQIERLIENPDLLRGAPTGSDQLDELLGGITPGLWAITGPTGAGKAQPLSEPVLTVNGWRTMGDLRVGDMVVDESGLPTSVLGVYPQGVREVCEITFSDGVTVKCDWDHLWAVHNDWEHSAKRPFRVLTARQLLVGNGADGRGWRVPHMKPVWHGEADLPIDPYILGVLLGDGSLTQPGATFTTMDDAIIDAVRERLPEGMRISLMKDSENCWRVTLRATRLGDENPIARALAGFGLRVRSEEKSIPPMYFNSSQEQRLELLRGLMDTDGGVNVKGKAEFYTTSVGLRDGVGNLVRSLGGTAGWSSKIPTYVYKGIRKKGRRAYTLNVRVPVLRIFNLPRKAEAVHGPRRLNPRRIVSIEPAGQAACVCISVENPTQLYVTTGYTVTHNTTMSTWILWKQAQMGHPVAITSFEQTPIGTVQKLLRMQLGRDFTTATKEQRRIALKELGKLPIYIVDHYGQIAEKKAIDLFRFMIRRWGVTRFLFDHLHFMIDPVSKDKTGSIESLVRAFAEISVQEEIATFLIVHPNGGHIKTGRRVHISDCKGATAIMQDSHVGIVVTKCESKPNQNSTEKVPAAKVFVDKVRSEFGVQDSDCVLFFDNDACVYDDSWYNTPAYRRISNKRANT